MNLSISNIYRFAFTYFIPLIMINAFISIFQIDVDRIIYYPPILLLFLMGLSFAMRPQKCREMKFASVYFFYLVFSGILYAINDAPISCYLYAILNTLFPLVFVFLGYHYSDDNKFNKWFIYGCAFCFIFGLFFYFTTPPFYVHFLANIREMAWYSNGMADENTLMESFRFSALFGDSYMVSYLSIPALVMSLSNTIDHRVNINKSLLYVYAFVSFVSAILCQQRIAIAFALLVPLFYSFFSKIKGAGSRLLLIYIILILIVLLVLDIISHMDRFMVIQDNVLDRFDNMNFNDAMSDRTGQYTGFRRQTDWSFLFGLGLGSCGGSAREVGLDGVTDGWYVKFFYESGIVGIMLFASILIPTLIRALKKIKLYDIELVIIAYFLAASLGADAISTTIPTAVFWYSVGRVWNPRYYNNLKNKTLNC